MSIGAKEIRILGQAGYSIEQIAQVAEEMERGAPRRYLHDLRKELEDRGKDNQYIARTIFETAFALRAGIAMICECRAGEQRYCRCPAHHAERWLK